MIYFVFSSWIIEEFHKYIASHKRGKAILNVEAKL
jgi:hypothetical protein